MQASQSNRVIKAALGSDVRRISVPSTTSFEDLKKQLVVRFGVAGSLALKWVDEDGDQVTIANENDLREAFDSMDKLRFIITEEPHVTTAVEQENAPIQTSTAQAVLIEEPKIGQTTAPPTIEAPQQVHDGIWCDGCNTCPIRGVRYTKQVERDTHDVCSGCYSNLDEETKATLTPLPQEKTPELQEKESSASQPPDSSSLNAHIQGVLRELDVELPSHMVEKAASHLQHVSTPMIQALIAKLDGATATHSVEPSGALCVEVAGLLDALELSVPEHIVVNMASHLTSAAPMIKGLLSRFSSGEGACEDACASPCGLFSIFNLFHGAFPSGNAASTSTVGPAIHHGVSCDRSGMSPIVGVRWKKLEENYDLCEEEFAKLDEAERSKYQRIEAPRPCGGCPMGGTGMQGGMPAFMQAMQQGMQRMQQHMTPAQAAKGDTLPEAPLSRGARGPGVAQLQAQLIELGALSPDAIRFHAGMYGPRTCTAIAEVQRVMGNLEPSGDFDDAVRAHLLQRLSSNPETEVSAPTTESAQEWTAVEKADDADENAAVLISMGFGEHDVAAALDATKGSLERAADWLFVNSTQEKLQEDTGLKDSEEFPAVPLFPAEWESELNDMLDMGFDEVASRQVLSQNAGNFKESIRTLVQAERKSRDE